MYLLPFQRITLDCSYTPHQVESAVTGLIGNKEYSGKAAAESFRIIRNIKGRNTYNPWILGRVRPTQSGSLVTLVLLLHPIALVFCVGLWGFFTFSYYRYSGDILVPILVLLFFHLILYFVGFLPELNKTQKRLREALNVQKL